MYTQEQINTLDKKTCEKTLEELKKTWDFNKVITRYTDEIDRIVNYILSLEDRIKALELQAISQTALAAKVPSSTGRRAKIHTPLGICKNIVTAAAIMGVSKATLNNRLKSDPTNYYRCE